MFVDETELKVKAGRGGDGHVSFHREKYVDKGGPDGGDGGRGGDVVLVASHHLDGLGHLRYTKEIKAKNGGKGGTSNCHGANADDVIIEVPVGTLVYELVEEGEPQSEEPPEPASDEIHAPPEAFTAEGASGEDIELKPRPRSARLLVDMNEHGMRYVAAYGGQGGLGNKHFATATNQRPTRFKPGKPGQARHLRFELKLIADAGLVGLPNAGKSTFLSRCTKARPKIGAYPFTTLVPYLGVVQLDEEHSFLLADIPGLIEGASQGKGLGHKFLRHVERTRVLIHLIDCSENEPEQLKADHDVIVRELSAFSVELALKPRLLVANKSDVPGTEEKAQELGRLLGRKVHVISGVTGAGLKELLWEVYRQVQSQRVKPEGEEPRSAQPGLR
ncbi:GTPase ObgE [bacterium]|nr:MAG: GTPase ObgE [bacterium]RIK63081.1 MAG: GTPase ObgE [Planctomycetota bacterium]